MFQRGFNKNGPSQSFSVVGVQHHKYKADRAIQYIINMDSKFVVHVSLHCTDRGVDDLLLKLFSIRRAFWFHNWVKNIQSGLTPIELLTKTKSDHQDFI